MTTTDVSPLPTFLQLEEEKNIEGHIRLIKTLQDIRTRDGQDPSALSCKASVESWVGVIPADARRLLYELARRLQSAYSNLQILAHEAAQPIQEKCDAQAATIERLLTEATQAARELGMWQARADYYQALARSAVARLSPAELVALLLEDLVKEEV